MISGFARLVFVLALFTAVLDGNKAASAGDAIPPREDAATFKVMTFNVGQSRDLEAFDAYVAAVSPDVVMLQEAREARLRKTILADYPFHVFEPGLIIASRFRPAPPEAAGSPFLSILDSRAFLRLPVVMRAGGLDQVVSIYDFHPTSPRMHDGEARRRTDYAAITGALRQEDPDRPLIVAGDFNAVPQEEIVLDLAAVAGLSFFDGGTLATPTRFAREFGLPAWVGVPIDHVAARGPFRLVSRTVGPDLGSDHLPVVVEVEFGAAH
jgi:endonuclease/exonuclease/phosphatase (EEP) superfamily protein YafD